MGEDINKGMWENILEKIRTDKGNCFCIPFLGAGANVRSVNLNYEGLPVGAKVAFDVAKKMENSLFKWKEVINNWPDLKGKLEKNFGIHWLNDDAEIKKFGETIIISDTSSENNFILISLNSDKTEIEMTYLLCWKDVQGQQKQLKSHLAKNYKIDLTNPKLKNSNQGKTINISDGLNSVNLQYYAEILKNNSNDIYEYIYQKNNIDNIYKLIINDGRRTPDLIVRLENNDNPEVVLPSNVRYPKNLAHVSLQYEITNNRYDLITALKEEILSDCRCDPSPLLKVLVELPFQIIITTNFDGLLERAFDGYEFIFTWNYIKGDDENRLKEYLKNKYNLQWINSAQIEKSDNNIIKIFTDKNAISLTCIDKEYLFDLNKIPGDDNGKLIDFLKQTYKFDWLKTNSVKISKDNDAIFKVSFEDYYISVSFNKEKTKLILIIDDGRTDEFIVKSYDNSVLVIKDRENKVILSIDGTPADELISKIDNKKINIYKYNEKSRRNYKVLVHPKKMLDVPQRKSDKIIDEIKELQKSGGCLIYKIHGSFNHHLVQKNSMEDSIVVTEDDYITLLTSLRQDFEKSGTPQAYILGEIRKSTLLFLGYSLEDWDFRMLHSIFLEPIDQNVRDHDQKYWLAIQKAPPEFWKDYWMKKMAEIKIFDMDVYAFANSLKSNWHDYLQKPEKAKTS